MGQRRRMTGAVRERSPSTCRLLAKEGRLLLAKEGRFVHKPGGADGDLTAARGRHPEPEAADLLRRVEPEVARGHPAAGSLLPEVVRSGSHGRPELGARVHDGAAARALAGRRRRG
jgi:hypothetical protein